MEKTDLDHWKALHAPQLKYYDRVVLRIESVGQGFLPSSEHFEKTRNYEVLLKAFPWWKFEEGVRAKTSPLII